MKNFITFIFIAALIGLGLLIGRGAPSTPTVSPNTDLPTVTESTSTTPDTSPLAQGGGAPTGRLFALVSSAASSEIISYDVVTKAKKIIFSDKSTAKKIKVVSPISRDGDTILALVAEDEDPAGQLISLATDGSSKQSVLIDNFAGIAAPVISPDKTKLALINFSNDLAKPGFTVTLMNVDGNSKKELVRNELGLGNLTFSPDGKEIAYINATAKGNQINAFHLTTGKERTLYTNDDYLITDFDWSPIGVLAATMKSSEKNAEPAEAYIIDPKNNSISKITSSSLTEHSTKIAPDGSGIAFIQAKQSGQPGTVVSSDTTNSSGNEFGTANQLLGWVK
jgi:Tol biopolymer transport system component